MARKLGETLYVPVNMPSISNSSLGSVGAALADGWISGEGAPVIGFENAMAGLVGRRNAVAVSNGSVALDLLFSSLGLGPGDEVIVPSFSIISCLSAVLRAGATPVFVDANAETWNADPLEILSHVTKRTKAILLVHIYGLPVDLDSVIEFAEAHGIIVIEDAAEAHGLKYKGRSCGSFGLASIFSFYANKNITTGEGGMVLTDDDELAARLRSRRNLSFVPEQRFVHYELGWNYRLSSLQAALGIPQISRLGDLISRRREIAQRYQEALGDISGIQFAPLHTDYATNDYWVVGIVLDEDTYGDAQSLASELDSAGVGTRPFFYPLHKQPVLSAFGLQDQPTLPVSEKLGSQGLYLPNGLGMADDLLELAIQRTREVLLRFE